MTSLLAAVPARDEPLARTLFFAQPITLVTWLYDWYRPLYETRLRGLVHA